MKMEFQNRRAWQNRMPRLPDIYVTGEVMVGNPGIEAKFIARAPQRINSRVLHMNLHMMQRSGMWPQVMARVLGRFDKVLPRGHAGDTLLWPFSSTESRASPWMSRR